ncbi:hypothetical protein [Fructilactobacillus florum]|nr:hypothetical protein [Fructilactobacillus florum]EKK20630.1 hypothetical protein B807_600 [Fructilactobacillus florum 2F]
MLENEFLGKTIFYKEDTMIDLIPRFSKLALIVAIEAINDPNVFKDGNNI